MSWTDGAALLGGIGTLLTGVAAVVGALVVVPRQLGFRRKASDLRISLKLMLTAYKRYMASEDGISWADYPANATSIITALASRTGLEETQLREFLDELKKESDPVRERTHRHAFLDRELPLAEPALRQLSQDPANFVALLALGLRHECLHFWRHSTKIIAQARPCDS